MDEIERNQVYSKSALDFASMNVLLIDTDFTKYVYKQRERILQIKQLKQEQEFQELEEKYIEKSHKDESSFGDKMIQLREKADNAIQNFNKKLTNLQTKSIQDTQMIEEKIAKTESIIDSYKSKMCSEGFAYEEIGDTSKEILSFIQKRVDYVRNEIRFLENSRNPE